MIRNLLISLFIGLFLTSCGGGSGGGTNSPSGLYDPVGTWTVTDTPSCSEYDTNFNCVEYDFDCVHTLGNSQFTYSITIIKAESGYRVVENYEDGTSFEYPTVIFDGNTYTFSDSGPDDNWLKEYSSTITLDSDNTFTGTTFWSKVDNDRYCNGASNLVGIKK